MTALAPSPEQFVPVPLEEVKGSFKMLENGQEHTVEVGWSTLSPLEQNLSRLILDGKYGDAYELAGRGKALTYNRINLSTFLNAVADQHDKTLSSAFSNDSVRNILGN